MSAFPETRWSLISQARDRATAKPALDALCRRYRHAIGVYLSKYRVPGMELDDLIQDFLAASLETALFQAADASRGNFRAFLITALRHHVGKLLEREQALKRGADQIVSDEAALLGAEDTSPQPDAAFDRAWAENVVMLALERLRSFSIERGKLAEFELMQPFLVDAPEPGDYERVARTMGVRPNTVAVNVARLRARFREMVKLEVGDTVVSDQQLRDEVGYLQTRVGQGGE